MPAATAVPATTGQPAPATEAPTGSNETRGKKAGGKEAGGNLPIHGKLLPVSLPPATPATVPQTSATLATADSHDGSDDKTTNAAGTDATQQPATALAAMLVLSPPPVTPPSAAPQSPPAGTARVQAALAPMARPSTPVQVAVPLVAGAISSQTVPTSAPTAIVPVFTAIATSPGAPASGEATPGPATDANQAQASAGLSSSVQPLTLPVSAYPTSSAVPPVALVSTPANDDAGGAVVTLRPVVTGLAAPIAAAQPTAAPAVAPVAPAPVAPVMVAAPALASAATPAIPATASRLTRTAAAPRDTSSSTGASLSTPTDDNAATPLTAGTLLVPPLATTPDVNPTASVPQDFAALVDRLVEARAAAQGTTTPQQVNAAVTHADFGKVSLTFQQDNTGLSVSMTSADPGFARAAQSAIAAGPALLTTDRSGTAAHQADGVGAGVNTPQLSAPASSVPTGQGSSASTGFGNSPQSQAQPQAQQSRPGAIAAAARATAANPAATGSGATSQGIFA